MNTSSASENVPGNNGLPITLTREEFTRHVQTVGNASWKEGITFMMLMGALLWFFVSVAKWNGDVRASVVAVAMFGMLFGFIHQDYCQAWNAAGVVPPRKRK